MAKRTKKINWTKKQAALKLLKRKLPILAANQAKNHFLLGFRNGGGQTDASLNGWAKRKTRPGRRARRDPGRAILVDSGALRADIRVRRATWRSTIVGTRRIQYAGRHNRGLAGMTQREFIGPSRALRSKTSRLVRKQLKTIG